MSLINDMLNDLENRQSQQTSAEVDLSWFIAEDRQPELVKKPQFWVFSILLLAVSVSVALHFLDPVGKPAQRRQSVDVEQARASYMERNPLPLAVDSAVTGQEKVSKTTGDAAQAAATADIAAEKTQALAIDESPLQSLPDQQHKPSPLPALQARETSRPLKKSLPLNAAQEDEQSYRNAQALLRKGRAIEAEQMLRGQLARTRSAIKSAQLLASLLLSEERHSALAALYQSLLMQGIESVDLRTVMGRSYLATGKPELAVDLLSRSAPDVLEHPAYHEVLALAAQRSHRYELSARTYQRLLKTDARRADWWMGLAIGFDQRQNYNAARVGYRRALHLASLSTSLKTYAQTRLQELGPSVPAQSKDQ